MLNCWLLDCHPSHLTACPIRSGWSLESRLLVGQISLSSVTRALPPAEARRNSWPDQAAKRSHTHPFTHLSHYAPAVAAPGAGTRHTTCQGPLYSRIQVHHVADGDVNRPDILPGPPRLPDYFVSFPQQCGCPHCLFWRVVGSDQRDLAMPKVGRPDNTARWHAKPNLRG